MGRSSVASQRGQRKEKRSIKHKKATTERKAKGKARLRMKLAAKKR